MDENNNNEEKASKKIKNAGKKIIKIVTNPFIKPILIGISIFFIILLAFGVINLIPYLIRNWIASLFGFGDSTQANATLSEHANRIVCINEHGGYDITVENFSKQILQKLEENKVNIEAADFITENMDDMIDKYIKAEVQTMYPKTGKSGDLDGLIKVQRASAEKGIVETLNYMNYDTFKNYSGSDVLKYFSINPENFKLCIAVKSTTIQYDANDNPINTTSSIEKQELEYQTAIQNYSTPFNFFLTLHMISLDEKFMNELVNGILEKDEPIVLTYVESTNITTTNKEYTGTEITVNVTEKKEQLPSGEIVDGVGNPTASIEKNKPISNDDIEDYYKYMDEPPAYFKEEKIKNTGVLQVTKADSWLKSVEKTIGEVASQIVNEGESNETIVEENMTIETSDSGKDENNIITIEKKKLDVRISEKTIITSENRRYAVVDKENEIKVDDFIDLIKKYPKTENNFVNSPSNIFDLLHKDEMTQQHEKIMRYVIFQLNGIDYGVSLEDLEYLLSDSFNVASASTLLKEYIRYWENSGGAPTNADGTKYIIESDGYGNPTVGYGIDIKNGGYTQIFIDNGYPTEIGGEVDVEFVDALEEQEIADCLASVKAKTSGLDLTQYQINALVSRSYNCGVAGAIDVERGSPSMDFVDSYNAYWNQERDDLFEEKSSTPDFSHQLYEQYMKKPNTAKTANGSEFSPGLERRRKSEWALFQTGYYGYETNIDKWHTSGADICAIAEEIHSYMEANNYTYCVYGGNDYEECGSYGKSCGLSSTFESSKTGNKTTCCATFVSWVLQEAGYLSSAEHENSANGLASRLESMGWIRVSISELEMGDVLCRDHHVEIYAGDNTSYNAGSGNAIRSAAPASTNVNGFSYGLRAP